MLVEQEKRYRTVCEMFASWLSPTKILKLERHKFLVFSVVWLPYNLLARHQWSRSVYSILQIILRCFNTCILWPDLDSLGKHRKESEQCIKPGFTEAMKCPVNNYGEVIAYLLLRLHLISLLKMMEELQQDGSGDQNSWQVLTVLRWQVFAMTPSSSLLTTVFLKGKNQNHHSHQ